MLKITEKLNELALGYAGSIVSIVGMLLLGTLGNMGLYSGAAQMMGQGHMFFSLSIAGIITGMIEAAIIGFIALYALGWVYNKFV